MKRSGWVLCALCLVACSSGDDESSDPSGADAGAGADGSSAGTSGGGGGNGAGSGSGSGGSSGTSSDDDGSDASVADGDGGGFGGSSDGSVPALTDPFELCGGPCECADGIDNDGDGFIDGFDVECTGPGDNDEGSFATGIPGDNVDPKWQDCFYDGNSGGGDDGCRYSTDCLTGDLDSDHRNCQVSQKCIDFCQPRTPNGCDCFGCCTFTLEDGGERSVILEASCEKEDLESCTACIPAVNGCRNECGRCELCPGKTLADLPDDCGSDPPAGGSGGTGGSGGSGGNGGSAGGDDDPPPGYVCDEGQDLCEVSSDCGPAYYCSFGCCLVALF